MTSAVTFKRSDYTKNLPRWQIVDDTQGGLQDEKTRQSYIVEFENAGDENGKRFKTYVQRAIFYNYVNRTQAGLVGLATAKDLSFESGPRLEYAAANIDGKGTTLEQAYKRALMMTAGHGRYGILADFPTTDGPVTQADIASGAKLATATPYEARQITNWGYDDDNRLSLVVLMESAEVRADDGFTIEAETRYRVLRLVDSVYEQVLYSDAGEVLPGYPINPRNSAGQLLDYIPFQFIGSENNDANIDQSPMYDLAVLNIGHFRNSADYENSAFLCGQPQPWAAGLTQNWVDNVLGGKFSLGSGSFLPLPEGGSFGIEQTQPNQQAFEAMGHKQEQMMAMGAKMVTPESMSNSATEAAINNESEKSVLQTTMDNVTDAYNTVLAWMGDFMGEPAFEFDNPTDLGVFVTNPQLLQQMRESWFAGLIADQDVRAWMRRHGLIEREDEAIDGDIEDKPPGVDV